MGGQGDEGGEEGVKVGLVRSVGGVFGGRAVCIHEAGGFGLMIMACECCNYEENDRRDGVVGLVVVLLLLIVVVCEHDDDQCVDIVVVLSF